MPGRDAAIGLLLDEQERASRRKKPNGMRAEDLLRLLGGAAPIAGTAIGGIAGLAGGPAAPLTATGGATLGGAIGGLAGMGANMAADHMRATRASPPWTNSRPASPCASTDVPEFRNLGSRGPA